MNNLNGFDLVYAVSQKAINGQLQLLSALSMLPAQWKCADPQGLWSIDVAIGTPVVNAVTGNAGARNLAVTFPFASGTMSYTAIVIRDGKPVLAPKMVDVAGWALELTINLSLAEIAQADIADHKRIPAAVKQQLQKFTVDMYSISHLFLDFEDADLILDSYKLVPPQGKNDPGLSPPNVIEQLRALVQSVIETLRGSDNPFIFGYAAANKRVPPSNAAFVPTGTSYSMFAEGSDPDRSSLNFLSETEGRPVPSDGRSGTFDHNWIPSGEAQGVYVVAQTLLMGILVAPFGKLFGFELKDFQQSKNGIVAKRSKGSHHTTTITFTPVVGQPRYACEVHQTFRVQADDMAGSNVGYADVDVLRQTAFVFGFDGNNDLTLGVETGSEKQKVSKHPNALGEFEDMLAAIADAVTKAITNGAVDPGFKHLSDKSWPTLVAVPLQAMAKDLRLRLVLAAGSEFLFKDAVMTAEGHLAMSTTIRN